jgi:signal peptidase I
MSHRWKRWGIGCAVAFVAVNILLLAISKAAFPTYRNTTGAMEPTIAVGDVVLANTATAVTRGDVIVHAYPPQPQTLFIKRVIGIPGDEILIRDKRLFVNGRAMSEPYVVHSDPQVFPLNPALPEPYRSRDQFGPFSVPPGQLFVLGDNRDRSSDSRFWGTVPQTDVRGRVLVVASPKGWRRLRRRLSNSA